MSILESFKQFIPHFFAERAGQQPYKAQNHTLIKKSFANGAFSIKAKDFYNTLNLHSNITNHFSPKLNHVDLISKKIFSMKK